MTQTALHVSSTKHQKTIVCAYQELCEKNQSLQKISPSDVYNK